MSVTFASGIIPTSVSNRLVISISRFSVTTKYLRHQVAIFQPCHTASTPHSTQMIGVPLTLPDWAADSVKKPAATAPARITIAGPNNGYRMHPYGGDDSLSRQKVAPD